MWSDSDGERELAMMYRPDCSSDVVLMDERMIASASRAAVSPPISQLNVSKSSRVHIGPKFVSVTQKVRNTEEIKGQLLGLELVSSQNTRKLRCSIAVFVCWALIVTVGLSFYVFHYALSKNEARLDLDIHEPWYLRRGDWQAMRPYTMDFLELPVSFVIIGHTVSQYCNQKYDCIKKIINVQKSHLDARFEDIGPNFLISGNGIVFEGRGANVLSTMLKGWNRRSITIMFLGDYRTDKTTPAQFEHLDILLNQLVKQGVLRPDYTILGQCQVKPLTVSPGRNILKELKEFQHWNSENAHLCLPG